MSEEPLSIEEIEALIRNSGFSNPETRLIIARAPEDEVNEILRRLDAEKDEQEGK